MVLAQAAWAGSTLMRRFSPSGHSGMADPWAKKQA